MPGNLDRYLFNIICIIGQMAVWKDANAIAFLAAASANLPARPDLLGTFWETLPNLGQYQETCRILRHELERQACAMRDLL